MNRFFKSFMVAALVLFAVYLAGQPLAHRNAPQEISYANFYKQINEGKVQSGTFFKDNHFEGTLMNGKKIRVTLSTSDQARSALEATMREKKVDFNYDKPVLSDGIQSLLLTFLPMVVLIIFFYMLILRQAQAGGNQAMSFGRSRAKRLSENVPKVTFEDVAGIDEAKAELEEVVEFLRNSKKFQALGAEIP